MKQNNLTRKKVINLRSQGFSLREIALIVDKSLTRVHTIVAKLKNVGKRIIAPPPPSVVDDEFDVRAVLFMNKEGKSIRLIAQQLNIPKTRVWRILKKHKTVHNLPLTPKP